MNVLVRLPNWLGDVVMALPMIETLKHNYQNAKIDVVIKDSLVDVLKLSKQSYTIIPFSKAQYKGLSGIRKFGKELKASKNYDMYISCPDSFSSALMGYYSGAKQRIGYKTEYRQFLLTDSLTPLPSIHRSQSYLGLLRPLGIQSHSGTSKTNQSKTENSVPQQIMFNINSEAVSRRIPIKLAQEIIQELNTLGDFEYIFTGLAKEKDYVQSLVDLIPDTTVHNLTGKTSLTELIDEVKTIDGIISADSGLAHLANYLGVPTLVLFGAGDEQITSPVISSKLKIIRKQNLECAPCVSNTCALGHLNCLNQLEAGMIAKSFVELLNEN